MLAVTLISLLLLPSSSLAYFRLNAQTVPYLIAPKTRPARSTIISSMSSSSVNPALQVFRNGTLSLVNKERKKRGLVPLTRNAFLEHAAQAHADDMVKRKFFSHQSPEGKTAEDRIRAVGYLAKPCEHCAVSFTYGENIAKGQKNAKDVITSWMHSKMHRENILKREFKEFGLGYAGDVWVQNFGGVHTEK